MKSFFALAAAFALAWPCAGVTAKASYYGLFSDPGQVSQQTSGSITITTTAKGAFSGQIQVNGTRASFRGVFDAAGKANMTLKGKNMESVSVDLQLITGYNGDSFIVGAVGGAT